MTRDVTVIGVPLDLGAGRRGVDMGPSAFRAAGVDQTIRALGCHVQDAGDVRVSIAETRDPGDRKLKYLKEIRGVCRNLSELVEANTTAHLGVELIASVLGNKIL